MVTGINYTDQFQLFNAPAGSGKTTMINEIITSLPKEGNKAILCITFTNKAVEEIERIVEQDYVIISTIHSFISSFMLPFFHDVTVIDTYFDVYNDQLKGELDKLDKNTQARYCDKKGISTEIDIDIDIVKDNTRKISYNQSIYKNYLNGEVNHDDLLSFTHEIFKRYPKLRRNISNRFSHIIIDEYQDTNYKIVDLFYNSVKNTDTKFWLFGDRMQQIYENNDINNIVENDFKEPRIFKYNWRSQEKIVNVLNNLYHDSSYSQISNSGTGDKPLVKIIKEHNYDVEEGKLLLVLLSKELFTQIEAKELYDVLFKIYPYGSKLSAKDILISLDVESDDKIMQILSAVELIKELYKIDQFGELANILRNKEFINDSFFKVSNVNEIKNIATLIEDLIQKVDASVDINDILDELKINKIFQESYIRKVEENLKETERGTEFYESLLKVKYKEFINCYKETRKPSILTQHSVKGQGHKKVIINLDDYERQPNVRMYSFLYYLSHDLFSLKVFEAIQTMYLRVISDYDINFKKIKKAEFENNFRQCDELFNKLVEIIKSQDNNLYEDIEGIYFKPYRQTNNVTNFKKIFTLLNELSGVIQASKLFYVGCSRAKEELTINILEEKVASFNKELVSKFKELGFSVVSY